LSEVFKLFYILLRFLAAEFPASSAASLAFCRCVSAHWRASMVLLLITSFSKTRGWGLLLAFCDAGAWINCACACACEKLGVVVLEMSLGKIFEVAVKVSLLVEQGVSKIIVARSLGPG